MAATTKKVRGLFSEVEPSRIPLAKHDESGVRPLPVGALAPAPEPAPEPEPALPIAEPPGLLLPFPRLSPEPQLPPPPALPTFHPDVGVPHLPAALRGQAPVEHFDATALARPGSTVPPPVFVPSQRVRVLDGHTWAALVMALVGTAMLIPASTGGGVVRYIPTADGDMGLAHQRAGTMVASLPTQAMRVEVPATTAAPAATPVVPAVAEIDEEVTQPTGSERRARTPAAPAVERAAEPARRPTRAVSAASPEPVPEREEEATQVTDLPPNPYAQGNAVAAAEVQPADLPTTPDREEVERALGAVLPGVRACAPHLAGTVVWMRVRVAPSGRVTTASVQGRGASDNTSCMAREVRGARFPAFSAERFQVEYPFRL